MLRSLAVVVLVVLLSAAPAAAEDLSGALPAASGPFTGRTIVIDPGHQLGNHNFPRKINRLVPAGGFQKPCNSTGTATVAGVAEATVVWRIARVLERRLSARGAAVVMTRVSNRQDRWGPCVDERGRRGNRIGADLKISIHGDGATSSGRGFHVIAPARRPRWTADIARPSVRLARDVRGALRVRGFRVADYTAGGDGLDRRGDLGTLNLSDIPTVMVELGNLRNRHDARVLTSDAGRVRAARGLVGAVRRFLG